MRHMPDSGSKLSDFEKESVVSDEEPIPDKRELDSLELKMRIGKIMLLNVNESIFQTELQADELIVVFSTLQTAKHIKVYLRKLEISDLTNYPFTRKTYEMQHAGSVARHRIILAEAREPDKHRFKIFGEQKQLYKLFCDHCLVVVIDMADDTKVGPDKVKIQADVFLHNIHVIYYQQVIFRLINFLTASVLPFVNPDQLPAEQAALLARIEKFMKTIYRVYIYDATLYLKPNFLVEQKIKVQVNEILVHNKIKFEFDGRDKSGQMRPFYSESIIVDVNKVKGYGFSKDKLLISSDALLIDFNRFLFMEESKRLFGLDYFLAHINFGNKISIRSKELNVMLFKDDFTFLMAVLLNNVSADDGMDKFLMARYEVLEYTTPLELQVFFEQLNVYFRYDKPEQEKRSFCTFKAPDFNVYVVKTINNKKEVRLSMRELNASGIEVYDGSKERLLNIPFIRSVFASKRNERFDDAKRDQFPLKKTHNIESSFANVYYEAHLGRSKEDILHSHRYINFVGLSRSLQQSGSIMLNG